VIGLDTVLFTRSGFKKLKDLNLYDEVLTPLGMFEPILKMSRVYDIDYYFRTSTDEIIHCSKDLELPVYDKAHKERMICVSCIKDKAYYTTKILPYDSTIRTNEDLYKKGTEIPLSIDNKWLILSSYDRYELLCGLMDTPICEFKGEDGVYHFKPHSYQFEQGLIGLLRLFGFPVRCGIAKNHRYVKFGVQNIAVIDDIPIRDKYKDISKMPPNNRYCFMPIMDNGTLKESVKGRSIKVDGGLVLVGYSLIPVKCQV
jgi:hypothetical protein